MIVIVNGVLELFGHLFLVVGGGRMFIRLMPAFNNHLSSTIFRNILRQ